MPPSSDIKTGKIVKVDPQRKAGYIISDDKGDYVYFKFADVLEKVGLGIAQENRVVQYIQTSDPTDPNRLIGKQVTVLSGKPPSS